MDVSPKDETDAVGTADVVGLPIHRRSDYIIGFVTPAIGPNKSKKLTRLRAPAHNTRGKV